MGPTTAPLSGAREQHKLATRRALENAALRLFARDGFDATSIEAIAAEAKVSARTYFRYFATKDEVLTPDREERQALLGTAVAAAGGSPGRSALEIAAEALLAIAPSFEDERDTMLLRRQAAVTSPVLRGRLHDVVHTWERTLSDALLETTGSFLRSDVAAQAATAVWQGAITRWLDQGSGTLTEQLASAFGALIGHADRGSEATA
ncbi:MAG: TetR family transcriptional regulator [Nocardioides sp.]